MSECWKHVVPGYCESHLLCRDRCTRVVVLRKGSRGGPRGQRSDEPGSSGRILGQVEKGSTFE